MRNELELPGFSAEIYDYYELEKDIKPFIQESKSYPTVIEENGTPILVSLPYNVAIKALGMYKQAEETALCASNSRIAKESVSLMERDLLHYSHVGEPISRPFETWFIDENSLVVAVEETSFSASLINSSEDTYRAVIDRYKNWDKNVVKVFGISRDKDEAIGIIWEIPKDTDKEIMEFIGEDTLDKLGLQLNPKLIYSPNQIKYRQY